VSGLNWTQPKARRVILEILVLRSFFVNSQVAEEALIGQTFSKDTLNFILGSVDLFVMYARRILSLEVNWRIIIGDTLAKGRFSAMSAGINSDIKATEQNI